MHARSLGLEGEGRLRRGKGEGVGANNRFYLRNRCLYDVGEGLQLCQGIWRNPSKEGGVKHLNIEGTWGTYLAAAEEGVVSESGEHILDDERKVALKAGYLMPSRHKNIHHWWIDAGKALRSAADVRS